METFNNQLVNIPLYCIEEVSNCYFFERNKIYNIYTKKICKEVIRGSRGFNLNGKFYRTKDLTKIKVNNLSNNFASL